MTEPIYEQIKCGIRQRILAGELVPGDSVPSEYALAREFAVSRGQTRQALRDLEMEGFLIRERGRGSFVAPANQWNAMDGSHSLRTLVVAMPQSTDPYNVSVARGFVDAASEQGYHTTFYYLNGNTEHELQFLRRLRSNGTHGFGLYPVILTADEAELVLELERAGCPCVMFDRYLPNTHADFVGTQNRETFIKLTRLLLERGHTSIMYLARDFKDTVMQDRFAGYCDAMTAAGGTIQAFSMDLDSVLQLSPRAIAAERPRALAFLEQCLAQSAPPTAYCCSDNWTAEFLRFVLQQHGIGVPDAVEIASMYDEDPRHDSAFDFHIGLQNGTEIGRQTATLLIDRLAHPDREAIRLLIDADIREAEPVSHHQLATAGA